MAAWAASGVTVPQEIVVEKGTVTGAMEGASAAAIAEIVTEEAIGSDPTEAAGSVQGVAVADLAWVGRDPRLSRRACLERY